MASTHKHSRHSQRQKAHHMLSRAGYARGGAASGIGREDKAEDAAMVRKGVAEHESALHKGSPKTKLKLASGGAVSGHAAPQRLDKRARGGAMKGKKSKPQVTVNVISPSNPGINAPAPAPLPMPPPPMGGPPPSGPLPGGMTPPPPPPPMGGMRRGGTVKQFASGGKVATSMRDGSERPLADIDRPSRKDITERFYRGGELTHGPKMTGGAASGEGREEKSELQKRKN